MRSELFPYEVLSRDLDLKLRSVEFDWIDEQDHLQQEPVSERSINYDNCEIFLWAEENDIWDSITLSIAVEIPESEIPKVDEYKDELNVVAVANCSKSNLRQTWELKKSRVDLRWTGRITLDKIQYFGTVEFQCLMTKKALGRESRFTAESPPWKIHFDESQSPPIHGAIPIKWINFKETEEPAFRKYANETHYLAIHEAEPTLYLNSGFEGLPDLFSEDPRPRGLHLALYETVSSSIAKSVWLALFQTAVIGIRKDEDDEEYDWPENPWEKDVLQQLLPHIYEDLGEEAALRKAGQEVASGELGSLESEALAVINKKIINEGKAIRKAIHQMEAE